jgi:hypothetical protein
MYMIEMQKKDHFVEIVACDIPTREEAEYILAEYVLNENNRMHSFYILPQPKKENGNVEIQRRSVIVL